MSVISDFLIAFFERLNNEKITYCILRNYENLPAEIGNDIDIWVDKKDWAKFYYLVKEIAFSYNYKLYYKLYYTPRLCMKGEGNYFLYKYVNNNLHIIHIDCWSYLHWKGFCFVDENIIAEHLLWNKKGFYIPAYGIEAGISLMKELIYHGIAKEKYKEKIKEFILKDEKTFFDCLNRPFGKKASLFIIKNARNGNWKNLEGHYRRLRVILIMRSILHPISQAIKSSHYLYAQIRRFIINPYGLFVVLLGPDGSGKSTTAKNLLESKIKSIFMKRYYFHGHFSFFPEIKKILSFLKLRKGSNTSQESGQLKPFGMFRSMIYPIYYGINYFIGHYFLWREKGRSGLIIFDRYFYDYYIQNQYNRCPRWLLKLIEKIIPRPDIIIYLKNKPEIIHARKPELTIEEISRQGNICEWIVENNKDISYTIETNTQQDTLLNIQKIFLSKIHRETGSSE